MGIFHRIWKKLAIWELSKFEIQICTFSWKFWISRMKSWSNTARWNFVDLKVSGRLTSIQVFIETGLVHPDLEKGTTEAQNGAIIIPILGDLRLKQMHCRIWKRKSIHNTTLLDYLGPNNRYLPSWRSCGSKNGYCLSSNFDENAA